MQKPQGGPKDRTPPKLLKATPPNMTRNFSARQIRLDFDEYFSLKNQTQEITVSPTTDKPPTFKTSKKSLIVDFKDTLQKNTTYVINFGKSIADLNEGNVLNNFTYVFSTGPHIDSLSVSGNVQDLMAQEKEKDVTVMLFPLNKDTLWGKKKPTIFAVTDSSGNFSLNNLHDGDYRIYALKEKAPNRIYDKDDELVAFQTATIHLKKDTANIHLNLFKQEPDKFRLTERRFEADGKMLFIFNKPVEKPSVKILYPPALDAEKIVDFNKTRDTAMVYMKNMDFDSIRVSFLQNATPIDTVALRKSRKETFDRTISLKYNTTFDNKIRAGNTLVVTTSTPIQTIDNSLITLNEDSTNVSNFTITKDTATMKRLTFNYRWKANSRYQLIFNEGALTSIYGDKNKKFLKPFQLDKPDNYGPLTLKVTVPDTSKGYVIELLDDQKNIVHRDPLVKSGNVVYKNYPVGKYNVRVIYDDNKNGKWDSGNVKKRIQPENIWVYPKQITLRSNWEAEEPIDIPKEPATH
ncbi:Ig-like domain-containing protein [Mucilaginibacter sp. BT774]|uniref:Ig-like domain-containing protein n=1 Tax=Mucilaginibacter sp. BT774 TaxID=3062276 RepID=UPI0026775C78|nr:Ig-like domain-containing protein [Mucilaginibacter sp. BT774]MDO3626754.1 Ig-like domain-containing protein [Mucilaginibacter sp. BT774]